MSELKGKIDFTLFISVHNANPNGDPLNGNRPRINLDGYGETVFRIWDSGFLFSQMTGRMTLIPV